MRVFAEFSKNPEDDAWHQCDCVPVGNDDSVHVICRQVLASTVPPLPTGDGQTLTAGSIVALSMTDGGLAFIQQDAFRMHDIQALDFSDNQIQTVNVNAFRGLEMKLTHLSLKHNNLSVIPAWALTYLHHLQVLRLDGNRISHVRANTFDETQLNNLHFLHLDNNQISFIPNMAFARLRLIVLTLSNNRITHLEKMSLPPSLSILELRNNLLTQIPYLALKDKIALQVLDLDGNNISMLHSNSEVHFKNEIRLVLRNNKIRSLTSTSFKSFRKFKELDLSYNQISSVHPTAFDGISQIKALDLSYNSIAFIARGTLKNLAKNLEKLNLEENIFHTLPDALMDLRNLTHLNLNGNKLTKLNEEAVEGLRDALVELSLAYNRLKMVPTNLLNGMSRLQHLDLSKNNIKSLHRLAFGTFDGTGTSLIHLNLAGNQLKVIEDPGVFLYMTSLAYLDLSYNQLDEIEPKTFEKLPGLERLYLQNNKLKKLPLHASQRMQNLRQLNLDNNEIKELPDHLLTSTPHLEHLSIAGNQIHSINDRVFHSSNSKTLKSLNLAGNQISNISSRAFQHMDNLQVLKLNNNRIRTIDSMVFAELRNLRHLDLSHNEIIWIHPQAFSSMPVLETLLLDNNQIEKIDRSAFYRINRIETLNLSNNQLKNFSCEQLGSIQTVYNLNLAQNRIEQIDLTCILRSLVRLDLGHNFLETIRKSMMDGADRLLEITLKNNGILELQGNTFSCCPKLSTIDLSHNHLKTIQKGTFSDQELLNRLDISYNALQNFQLGCFGKNNILLLNAAFNELSKVPIEALQSTSACISSLNMDNNRIRTLESSQFFGLQNLTQLVISRNFIETIEDGAFEHLPALKYLDISNNPISTWSPSAFRDMSSSMDSLNLANTGLFSIPRMNHHAIRHFNLSMNKIYDVSRMDIKKTAQLISLDISNNNIQRIEEDVFEDLVNLKELNISGNPIKEILGDHFRPLYQLETLSIHDLPSLSKLPNPSEFSHLASLRNLQLYNLAGTGLKYNTTQILQHLPPLRSLFIEFQERIIDGQLHDVDMTHMRQLTITGRNITNISSIAVHALRGYKVHLSVINTSLQEFPTSLFTTLGGIYFLTLSLSHNKIRTVQPFKNSIQPWINQHGTILEAIDLTVR
ncbi:leucine Rich repeat-containing domain protein [Necator americanus]|uniref:Leucine Rich repeat-containing domain protein n=1 Tax=Necator americanus TaxID=51031 RepID=W2T1H2_NECAM|nr:leucine Rich repeat-containing domain protein [Necator americanus]ETN75414.1 leucine Rich repeat-containing domain protein [Necator americanus]